MVVIANPGPNRIHMEEDGAITIQDSNGYGKIHRVPTILAPRVSELGEEHKELDITKASFS